MRIKIVAIVMVAYVVLVGFFMGLWSAEGWPHVPDSGGERVIAAEEARFWSAVAWPLTLLLRYPFELGRRVG